MLQLGKRKVDAGCFATIGAFHSKISIQRSAKDALDKALTPSKNKTRKTAHLENCTSIDPKQFQTTVFDVTLVFVLYPTHSAAGCSAQSLISPLIAENQCPQVHSWRNFVSLMCQVDFSQR